MFTESKNLEKKMMCIKNELNVISRRSKKILMKMYIYILEFDLKKIYKGVFYINMHKWAFFLQNMYSKYVTNDINKHFLCTVPFWFNKNLEMINQKNFDCKNFMNYKTTEKDMYFSKISRAYRAGPMSKDLFHTKSTGIHLRNIIQPKEPYNRIILKVKNLKDYRFFKVGFEILLGLKIDSSENLFLDNKYVVCYIYKIKSKLYTSSASKKFLSLKGNHCGHSRFVENLVEASFNYNQLIFINSIFSLFYMEYPENDSKNLHLAFHFWLVVICMNIFWFYFLTLAEKYKNKHKCKQTHDIKHLKYKQLYVWFESKIQFHKRFLVSSDEISTFFGLKICTKHWTATSKDLYMKKIQKIYKSLIWKHFCIFALYLKKMMAMGNSNDKRVLYYGIFNQQNSDQGIQYSYNVVEAHYLFEVCIQRVFILYYKLRCLNTCKTIYSRKPDFVIINEFRINLFPSFSNKTYKDFKLISIIYQEISIKRDFITHPIFNNRRLINSLFFCCHRKEKFGVYKNTWDLYTKYGIKKENPGLSYTFYWSKDTVSEPLDKFYGCNMDILNNLCYIRKLIRFLKILCLIQIIFLFRSCNCKKGESGFFHINNFSLKTLYGSKERNEDSLLEYKIEFFKISDTLEHDFNETACPIFQKPILGDSSLSKSTNKDFNEICECTTKPEKQIGNMENFTKMKNDSKYQDKNPEYFSYQTRKKSPLKHSESCDKILVDNKMSDVENSKNKNLSKNEQFGITFNEKYTKSKCDLNMDEFYENDFQKNRELEALKHFTCDDTNKLDKCKNLKVKAKNKIAENISKKNCIPYKDVSPMNHNSNKIIDSKVLKLESIPKSTKFGGVKLDENSLLGCNFFRNSNIYKNHEKSSDLLESHQKEGNESSLNQKGFQNKETEKYLQNSSDSSKNDFLECSNDNETSKYYLKSGFHDKFEFKTHLTKKQAQINKKNSQKNFKNHVNDFFKKNREDSSIKTFSKPSDSFSIKKSENDLKKYIKNKENDNRNSTLLSSKSSNEKTKKGKDRNICKNNLISKKKEKSFSIKEHKKISDENRSSLGKNRCLKINCNSCQVSVIKNEKNRDIQSNFRNPSKDFRINVSFTPKSSLISQTQKNFLRNKKLVGEKPKRKKISLKNNKHASKNNSFFHSDSTNKPQKYDLESRRVEKISSDETKSKGQRYDLESRRVEKVSTEKSNKDQKYDLDSRKSERVGSEQSKNDQKYDLDSRKSEKVSSEQSNNDQIYDLDSRKSEEKVNAKTKYENSETYKEKEESDQDVDSDEIKNKTVLTSTKIDMQVKNREDQEKKVINEKINEKDNTEKTNIEKTVESTNSDRKKVKKIEDSIKSDSGENTVMPDTSQDYRQKPVSSKKRKSQKRKSINENSSKNSEEPPKKRKRKPKKRNVEDLQESENSNKSEEKDDEHLSEDTDSTDDLETSKIFTNKKLPCFEKNLDCRKPFQLNEYECKNQSHSFDINRVLHKTQCTMDLEQDSSFFPELNNDLETEKKSVCRNFDKTVDVSDKSEMDTTFMEYNDQNSEENNQYCDLDRKPNPKTFIYSTKSQNMPFSSSKIHPKTILKLYIPESVLPSVRINDMSLKITQVDSIDEKSKKICKTPVDDTCFFNQRPNANNEIISNKPAIFNNNSKNDSNKILILANRGFSSHQNNNFLNVSPDMNNIIDIIESNNKYRVPRSHEPYKKDQNNPMYIIKKIKVPLRKHAIYRNEKKNDTSENNTNSLSRHRNSYGQLEFESEANSDENLLPEDLMKRTSKITKNHLYPLIYQRSNLVDQNEFGILPRYSKNHLKDNCVNYQYVNILPSEPQTDKADTEKNDTCKVFYKKVNYDNRFPMDSEKKFKGLKIISSNPNDISINNEHEDRQYSPYDSVSMIGHDLDNIEGNDPDDENIVNSHMPIRSSSYKIPTSLRESDKNNIISQSAKNPDPFRYEKFIPNDSSSNYKRHYYFSNSPMETYDSANRFKVDERSLENENPNNFDYKSMGYGIQSNENPQSKHSIIKSNESDEGNSNQKHIQGSDDLKIENQKCEFELSSQSERRGPVIRSLPIKTQIDKEKHAESQQNCHSALSSENEPEYMIMNPSIQKEQSNPIESVENQHSVNEIPYSIEQIADTKDFQSQHQIEDFPLGHLEHPIQKICGSLNQFHEGQKNFVNPRMKTETRNPHQSDTDNDFSHKKIQGYDTLNNEGYQRYQEIPKYLETEPNQNTNTRFSEQNDVPNSFQAERTANSNEFDDEKMIFEKYDNAYPRIDHRKIHSKYAPNYSQHKIDRVYGGKLQPSDFYQTSSPLKRSDDLGKTFKEEPEWRESTNSGQPFIDKQRDYQKYEPNNNYEFQNSEKFQSNPDMRKLKQTVYNIEEPSEATAC